MKISKKLSFVGFLLAVGVGGLTILKVGAQGDTVSDQQTNLIITNCVLVKNTLNQLHASDALLRVNMGQIYESMSTKLMDKFNNRVANNDFNNNYIVSVFENYNLALNSFRSDYIDYEEYLSSAIGIDCTKQPVSFYDAVALARTKRVKVHEDILKLGKNIDQYKLAVSQFEKDHFGTDGGVKR